MKDIWTILPHFPANFPPATPKKLQHLNSICEETQKESWMKKKTIKNQHANVEHASATFAFTLSVIVLSLLMEQQAHETV